MNFPVRSSIDFPFATGVGIALLWTIVQNEQLVSVAYGSFSYTNRLVFNCL